MDREATRDVLDALERHGVRYAIFGGVAVNLHGLARATQDLDVFVAPDADNIVRLREALHSVFDDESIDRSRRTTCWGAIPLCSTCRRKVRSTWTS